jgi:hypothetical protein
MSRHASLVCIVNSQVVCKGVGQVECDQLLVFKLSHSSYDQYEVMIQVPQDAVDAAFFINTTDFYYEYENKDFAYTALVMKYVFIAITLGVVYAYWWYANAKLQTDKKATHGAESGEVLRQSSIVGVPTWCKRLTSCFGCCCGPKTCPYSTPDQKWVTAIVLGAVLFNNPFAAFDYSENRDTRRFGEVAAVVSQFTYVCTIFLYWLVQFDGFLRDPPFSPRFYLPKVLFCGKAKLLLQDGLTCCCRPPPPLNQEYLMFAGLGC